MCQLMQWLAVCKQLCSAMARHSLAGKATPQSCAADERSSFEPNSKISVSDYTVRSTGVICTTASKASKRISAATAASAHSKVHVMHALEQTSAQRSNIAPVPLEIQCPWLERIALIAISKVGDQRRVADRPWLWHVVKCLALVRIVLCRLSIG